MNRSKRRGDRVDPWTVPVSSWIAAVADSSTCMRMEEFSYMSLRSDTSGTPKPSRIFQRHECPAELNAFLKSRSTLINLLSDFIACLVSHFAFCMTSCTALAFLNPNWVASRTACFSVRCLSLLVIILFNSW